jgi:integrase
LKEARNRVQPVLDELAHQASQTQRQDGAHKIEAAENLSLKIVMAAYEMQRPDLANPARIADALSDAVEVWGEAVTVRQLDGPMQHRFVANRRALIHPRTGERQLSDWTILTRLKCLWAAMNHCAKVAGLLKPESIPGRVAADEWRPKAHLPARELGEFGFAQLVDFVRAAAEQEHWLRATLICLAAGPRPMAALEVQPQNVDLRSATLRLQKLDERGRWVAQNDKRRGIVKLGPTMVKWFAFWNAQGKSAHHDPQYVTYQGQRLVSFDWVQEVARRAGVVIPKGLGAYVFRHFVASYLVSHGCPLDQVKVLLGHQVASGSTKHYVHLDPNFLAHAAGLLEQLLQELDAALGPDSALLVPHRAQPRRGASAAVEAVSGLEEQPDPLRYGVFFWSAFQQCAGRYTAGRPVRRGPTVALEADDHHPINGLDSHDSTLTRPPEA